MNRLVLNAITSLVLLAPLAASASPGFVTTSLNLRAGPDTDYPAVDVLPAGAPVDVQGCVDGYTWCDVIVDGNRGWVSGQYVQYEYDNRRVYVHDYGARIGIPIVAFALGAYWESNYRSRPWYGDRERWAGSSHGNRPIYHGSVAGYHSGPGYRPEQGYHGPVHAAPVYHDDGHHNDPHRDDSHRNDPHRDDGHRNDGHHDDEHHDDHGHEHEH